MGLQDAAIALNRFGLGARPGEMVQIAGDPRGWLLAQLEPETVLPAPLAALPSTADASAAFLRWITALGLGGDAGAVARLYKGAKPGAGAMVGEGGGSGVLAPGEPRPLSVEQSFVQTFVPGYATAVAARVEVAVTTKRPFFERLVRFWGNHFTVSAAKPECIALAPCLERDVARRHAVGRFDGLLFAATTHPAMLVYLDNVLSVGPDSYIGRHPEVLPQILRDRMKGVNENLAREILELHTLGVRSGYTQADVAGFARILSGWTVTRPGEGAVGFGETRLFRFLSYAHEPGPQTLLGKRYDQSGMDQGETVLDDLARHPATATHIASKLARHFVGDNPPEPVVERLARTFRETDGDLKSVMTTLIGAPEAWTPAPAKFKPPEDYVVSALRALDAPCPTGRQLLAVLDRMGQKPFYAPGPDGWADVEDAWIGPDPVWKRIEWASTLSRAHAAGDRDPTSVASDALGPGLSTPTLQAVHLADSPAQGLALLLASPEFQRR